MLFPAHISPSRAHTKISLIRMQNKRPLMLFPAHISPSRAHTKDITHKNAKQKTTHVVSCTYFTFKSTHKGYHSQECKIKDHSCCFQYIFPHSRAHTKDITHKNVKQDHSCCFRTNFPFKSTHKGHHSQECKTKDHSCCFLYIFSLQEHTQRISLIRM